MHCALILFQLSIWITSICALVLPTSESQYDASSQDDGLASRGFVTFKLVKKASTAGKFKIDSAPIPVRSAPTKNDVILTERDNEYKVVEAQEPVVNNSAGISQDGKDYSYFAEVKFGSEGKPLYMLLDTGASTTWVMGSSCNSTSCITHNTFGPDDSKTYNNTEQDYSVEYGTGSVRGQIVEDNVTVAGLSVILPFGVANTTSNQFTQFPFDGILGLSTSNDTWLSAVKNAKLIGSNLFGISLSRNADGTNDGEIVFGKPNQDKYTGDITYSSVTGNGWTIPMDDVTVSGKSAGIMNRTAYIDTGTSFVFGPPEDVEAMYKLIPGSSSTDNSTYTIPCDSDSQVAFSFSGKSWTVSSKDLISAADDKGVCTGNIHGVEYVSGGWLLGDVFLKNVYSVFDADNAKIGFATKAIPPAPAATPTPTAQPTTDNSSKPDSSAGKLGAGCSAALLVSLLSMIAIVI